MKIFLTGASGYIGGSIAAALLPQGHVIYGLARTEQRAQQLEALGMLPVRGNLDSADVLRSACDASDAVIHTADAEHVASVDVMLDALSGSEKRFLHTSGTSIVADVADGDSVGDVFDESSTVVPKPLRATRVAINKRVVGAANLGVHTIVICPSLIYGPGHGLSPDSIQLPWMQELAAEKGIGCHIGAGLNIWSNVHINDLVPLYLAALEKAPAGSFYYAENGECSMRELAAAISGKLGRGEETYALSVRDAVQRWGESGARYTMGSNSRVRAVAARKTLGWRPCARSLLDQVAD